LSTRARTHLIRISKIKKEAGVLRLPEKSKQLYIYFRKNHDLKKCFYLYICRILYGEKSKWILISGNTG